MIGTITSLLVLLQVLLLLLLPCIVFCLSKIHSGGMGIFLLKTSVNYPVNNVQTRCIVKGEAQKSPLSGDFLGGLIFSGSPVL